MVCIGFLFFALQTAFAQTNRTDSFNLADNPLDRIASDISAISKSVQTLNERMKEFLDKFGKIGGLNLSEKQQKLLLGFEVLNRAEQRLATLQKFQIELVEKQVTVRTRLIQIEQEIKPESIENSTAFNGSTKTVEIRENRRRTLDAELRSLQGLSTQIQSNLLQTNDELRDAQQFVHRLRRILLPQIEQEIIDL